MTSSGGSEPSMECCSNVLKQFRHKDFRHAWGSNTTHTGHTGSSIILKVKIKETSRPAFNSSAEECCQAGFQWSCQEINSFTLRPKRLQSIIFLKEEQKLHSYIDLVAMETVSTVHYERNEWLNSTKGTLAKKAMDLYLIY